MFDPAPPSVYSTAASDERFARRLLLSGNDLADAARAIAAHRRVEGWASPSAEFFAAEVDRVATILTRASDLVADAREQALASARMQ